MLLSEVPPCHELIKTDEMKAFKTVDDFINGNKQWHDELVILRKILNSTELQETVKWGGPCYTFAGKNVVGMGAFKSYFGLWFFQGALLRDKKKVLINAQEGRTKALRQWRFQSLDEVDPKLIKAYIKEAIEVQKSGVEIKQDRDKPVMVPAILKEALLKDKKAGESFKQLTKGKQREYANHVASAKREETKQKRLEKILPMILVGKGLNDKYKKS